MNCYQPVIRRFFLAAILVALIGCSKKVEPAPAPAAPSPVAMSPDYSVSPGWQQENNITYTKVYFATNRTQRDTTDPKKMFSADLAANLTYGYCIVSIPPRKIHTTGELETPFMHWSFLESKNKHIVLLHIETKTKQAYFNEISDMSLQTNKSALVFIHGYNVSFEDAARRTAQLAYDLKFSGAPIFYSWPSNGSLMQYHSDESKNRLSTKKITNFLIDLLSTSGIERVYLIAHSMGNRALTAALLDLLEQKPNFKDKIKEVILAAPDIDATVFRDQIAPQLAKTELDVTMYISSKDKALAASRAIHHGAVRAGDTAAGPIIVGGTETVDATNQVSAFFGHSYIMEERSLLMDLSELFRGVRAKERFNLQPVDTARGRYWEVKQ